MRRLQAATQKRVNVLDKKIFRRLLLKSNQTVDATRHKSIKRCRKKNSRRNDGNGYIFSQQKFTDELRRLQTAAQKRVNVVDKKIFRRVQLFGVKK